MRLTLSVVRALFRCALCLLHFMDTVGEGEFSLADVQHGFNAVDLRLPNGTLIKGGAFPRPKIMSPTEGCFL